MSKWLFLLFAGAGYAQMPGPNPLPGPFFPVGLREYLGLNNQQVQAIQQANAEFNSYVVGKQIRAAQVQRELAEEIAREPLDPMALGLRQAELETIRRQIRDRQGRTRETAAATLTDAQKLKLKALDDARKLQPVIAAAECENLLAPAASGNIIPASRWFDTTQFVNGVITAMPVGVVANNACGPMVLNGDFSGLIPAP